MANMKNVSLVFDNKIITEEDVEFEKKGPYYDITNTYIEVGLFLTLLHVSDDPIITGILFVVVRVLALNTMNIIFDPFIQVHDMKEKGMIGERYVLQQLNLTLGNDYTIFNHVLIPNKYSKTGYIEIDIVVVGPTGVYIVEVKNISGVLRKKEIEDKVWELTNYKRTNFYEVKNPVIQLKRQKKLLSAWLGESSAVEGLVVLSNPKFILIEEGNEFSNSQGVFLSKKPEHIIKIIKANKAQTINHQLVCGRIKHQIEASELKE